MANQAKISLSLDGNDQVIAGLKGVKKAEDELRQSLAASEKDYQSYSSSAAKGVTARSAAVSGLKAIMEGAYRAAVDFSRASNDIKPINFQQSADRAKAFDDVVTRLAVRSGKNVEELKSKFKATGVEIGYLPERVANTARALSHLTYNADAADAVKDLGDEANDTDRSLEEMVGLGEVLYNKLGVPANKVGESLQKIKNIAGDVQTVGGHIALEDTLVRLAPLLARFQGGVSRAAATVAVFGKGKNQQVGEQENAAIFGALESADPLLVTGMPLVTRPPLRAGHRGHRQQLLAPRTNRLSLRGQHVEAAGFAAEGAETYVAGQLGHGVRQHSNAADEHETLAGVVGALGGWDHGCGSGIGPRHSPRRKSKSSVSWFVVSSTQRQPHPSLNTRNAVQ